MSKREDDPLEVIQDPDVMEGSACTLCVTCGNDPEAENWPLTNSLSCLVGAGCVVLPPDNFDEVVERVKTTDKQPAAAIPAH